MRKYFFHLCMGSILGCTLVSSCQQQKHDAGVAQDTIPSIVEPQGPIVHSMPSMSLVDTIHVGSQEYQYRINRHAVDSLGTVMDEDGNYYVNNLCELQIMRKGQEIYHKFFTKESLQAYMSDDFMRKGIFDGFRFLRTADGKMQFSLCVSYPESDLFTPVLLTIDANGNALLEKDEFMTEEGSVDF